MSVPRTLREAFNQANELSPEELRRVRQDLLKRHETLHRERIEIGLQTMALSYTELVRLLREHTPIVEDRYVLEIAPTDAPEKVIEEGVKPMIARGFVLERVVGNPDASKIYAIFQKK